jgi:hypothetical protein
MNTWTHIVIEGYCLYSHLSEKKTTYHEVDQSTFKSTNKKRTIINKDYIPKRKRPLWCVSSNKKFTPQFNCLSNPNSKTDSKCPFFGYCEADNIKLKFNTEEEKWEEKRKKQR